MPNNQLPVLNTLSIALGLLTVLYSCSSSNAPVVSDGTILYPYRVKDKWGFCTEDKQLAIPCVYETVFFSNHFYAGQIREGQQVCYNNRATLINNAAKIILTKSGAILLNYLEAPEKPSGGDPVVDDPLLIEILAAIKKSDDWQSIPASTIHFADTNYHVQKLPDTALYLHSRFPELAIVKNGSKTGIFNFMTMSYFIAPDEVSAKDMMEMGLLYSRKNRQDNIPEPEMENADIAKRRDDPNTSYEYEVRECRPMVSNNSLGHIKRLKSLRTVERYNLRQFYDNEYNLLLDKIEQMECIYGNHFLVQRVSSIDSLTRQRITTEFVYDAKNNKIVAFTPKPADELKRDGMMFYYHDKYVHRTYYYNYKGKHIATIYNIAAQKDKTIKQLTSRDIGYDGQACNHYITAIRDNDEQPFRIYDEEFNLLDTTIDDIVGQNDYYFIIKKGGKVGLTDAVFDIILPPLYDSLRIVNNLNMAVHKDGLQYIVDGRGNTLYGGKVFDYVSITPLNGKYLAWKTGSIESTRGRVENGITNVYIIDTAGNIISDWEVNTARHNFELTATGKILKTPIVRRSGKHLIELYDPETGDVKSAPYVTSMSLEYKGNALLIQCYNRNEEAALLSANDLSIVVPFGKYEGFSSPEITTKEGMKAGIFVTAKPLETDEEERIPHITDPSGKQANIGYYSLDGTAYWKD